MKIGLAADQLGAVSKHFLCWLRHMHVAIESAPCSGETFFLVSILSLALHLALLFLLLIISYNNSIWLLIRIMTIDITTGR